MKKYDIVVIGGGPAGVISAVTAKKYYPDKNVILVRKVEKGVIPCGIPYVFSSLDSVDKNIMPDKPLETNNIDLMIDELVSIDRKNKIVKFASSEKIQYEKLVLAIGSEPIVPPIPGVDKKGIYTIQKDLEFLRELRRKIYESKNIVIIGGGFIGVEFADELSKIEGLNIHIVEMLPHCLSGAFDEELSIPVEEKLRDMGIKLHLGVKAEEFIGGEKVEQVKLSNGEVLPVDLVILAIGAKPKTKIAEEAGLYIGRGGGIWVDEYMRTSDPDIFAIGDCAEKRCFFTRKHIPVMLASIATSEARIAGSNLYELKVVRENRGTIAVFSTKVGDLALGSAGLTEKSAKEEGFEVITGVAKGVDKHPGALPGANQVMVKLIFSKCSGTILGGQVLGGPSAGEVINIIGLAIQKRVQAVELETLQMATHPWLTPAPTIYPVVVAAMNALSKIR